MEYAANLKRYIEGIRLMSVEVEVIDMITNGMIPKMSLEEGTQISEDLLEINETREEESECAPDLSKIKKIVFLKTLILQPCLKYRRQDLSQMTQVI